jgi:hypothetical protein
MSNKKVLSKAVSELNKAKAPAKPKDIITDPMGQWKYPGQNTRIPGNNITMQGVDYPIWAQPSVGPGTMMQPGQNYNFPEADYVDEYPQMQKGGSAVPIVEDAGSMNEEGIWVPDWEAIARQAQKLNAKTVKTTSGTIVNFNDNWEVENVDENPQMKKGGTKLSKKYTRNITAMNKLFAENYLFKKPKKKQIYDPNASFYKEGGEYMEVELTPEEIEAYKEGGYVVEDISVPSLNQQKFGPGGATDLDPVTMAKYLDELKKLENSVKKGYRNNKWYPHASVEGGADTIAYGHKLTPADAKYYQGITEKQAEALQQGDVLNKQTQAENIVDKKYGKGTFDKLPQDAQMLLVDYQYNVAGGLNKFPSFLDATVKGDKAKMLKEYERGSSAGKLTKRNNWTRSVIENLDYSQEVDPMIPVVPLANVPDATVVVPQVQPVPPVAIDPLKGIEYAKGGSVTKLTQEEIDQYIEDGWIVEELD